MRSLTATVAACLLAVALLSPTAAADHDTIGGSVQVVCLAMPPLEIFEPGSGNQDDIDDLQAQLVSNCWTLRGSELVAAIEHLLLPTIESILDVAIATTELVTSKAVEIATALGGDISEIYREIRETLAELVILVYQGIGYALATFWATVGFIVATVFALLDDVQEMIDEELAKAISQADQIIDLVLATVNDVLAIAQELLNDAAAGAQDFVANVYSTAYNRCVERFGPSTCASLTTPPAVPETALPELDMDPIDLPQVTSGGTSGIINMETLGQALVITSREWEKQMVMA